MTIGGKIPLSASGLESGIPLFTSSFALDGKPVRLLIMIAGPRQQQKQYLQILARIVIYLKNQRLREKLFDCKTPEDIVKEFSSFLGEGA